MSLLAMLFRVVLFLLETAVHFFKAVIFLILAIGLLWGIGLIFPSFTDALGVPCAKFWDCITSAASSTSSAAGSVYGTLTAEKPVTPSPTRAPTMTAVVQAPTATPVPAPTLPPPTAPPAVAVQPSEWDRTQAELDKIWGKDWPQTIKMLESFLERNPTQPIARSKLNSALISEGDLLLQSGDTASAIDRFVRAANLSTGDGTARAKLNALTPTPTPVPPPTRAPTPIPPPPVQQPIAAPAQQAPAPKPQSGVLGSASIGGWCREVHDTTGYFQDRSRFPQSAGWFCQPYDYRTNRSRDVAVDLNDVCRRAYNDRRAVARYTDSMMFEVECRIP